MNTRESDFWNERSGPRIAPEHFGEIVATAADIALVLTPGGRIVSVTTNPLNSALGNVGHWDGRNLSEFLAPDSREKVERHLAAVLDGATDRAPAIEVNHSDGADWDIPIRYTMHPTGRDGRVLMLGRDMRPVAELQQRLVRAQAAIEKDYEQQRVIETRFRVVLEAARDGLVLIDVASGRILDGNKLAARLLGAGDQPMAGVAFTQEFEGRRRGEFIDALCAEAAKGEGGTMSVDTRRGGTVRIVPQVFRNAGERVLLCRILPGSDEARAVDPLSDDLADIVRQMREGVVVIDPKGAIAFVNDAFLSLVDLDSAVGLSGRDMADFLGRGGVDLRTLSEGATCATKLIAAFGTRIPVEITASTLTAGTQALIIRETGRADAAAGTLAVVDGQEMTTMTEQVGTVPLRDIVASTTDVIEKQCIATAVELTNNNRVAAAEMLGLSRQSLYVKLRKYGLLTRDES